MTATKEAKKLQMEGQNMWATEPLMQTIDLPGLAMGGCYYITIGNEDSTTLVFGE